MKDTHMCIIRMLHVYHSYVRREKNIADCFYFFDYITSKKTKNK